MAIEDVLLMTWKGKVARFDLRSFICVDGDFENFLHSKLEINCRYRRRILVGGSQPLKVYWPPSRESQHKRPLRGYKLVCLKAKPIEDQKKGTSPQLVGIFSQRPKKDFTSILRDFSTNFI